MASLSKPGSKSVTFLLVCRNLPGKANLTRSEGSVNLPQCFVGLPWFERIFKDFQGIKEIIYLGQKNNFIKVAKHKFTKTAKQKITKLTTK